MEIVKMIQQGDVLWYGINELPNDVKVQKPKNGRYLFAEGETTGHFHGCIADENIQLFEKNGVLYCFVEKATEVTHQEHNAVVLEPGKYRVGIVREVDPFENEIRKVQD